MTKHFLTAAIGLAVLAIAATQGYGFMLQTSDAETSTSNLNVVSMIDELQSEIDESQSSCAAMMGKLDSALDEIDAALDSGVQNEESFLIARDAVSDMRLALPCLGEQLAQQAGPIVETLRAVSPITPFNQTDDDGFLWVGSGGGSTSGVGGIIGGGSSIPGGLNLRRLALIGGGIGVAVGASSSDDDDPGQPATVAENVETFMMIPAILEF